MSESGELVHFHDWRAARDRKAATRRLWRSRCSGLRPFGITPHQPDLTVPTMQDLADALV